MNTGSIQVRNFGQGGIGGVLHKVTGSFNGWCSVWFDGHGKMTHACHYSGARRVERDVKINGPIWREIEASTAAIRHYAIEQSNAAV